MVTKRICSMVIVLTVLLSSIDAINVFNEFEVNASTIQSTEVEIDAGENHTLLLRNDGSVWAWGQGKYGELGNGLREDIQVPTMIQGLSGIIDIDTIENNCIALKNDGTVYTWGKITLSDGTEIINDTPQLVSDIDDAISVAAGVNHYLAVKGDKTVVSWGNNADYQLGNGNNNDFMAVQNVVGLSNVAKVSAGEKFSMALDVDGYLYGWGDGYYYQFGDNTQNDRQTASKLNNISGVVDFSTGPTHILALMNNKTLYSWGYGRQCGANTNSYVMTPTAILSNVNIFETGSQSSFAIIENGENDKLWVWGYNDDYQLGNGYNTSRITPDDLNTVFSNDIVQIASGSAHTIVLTLTGEFYAWGDNSHGQYGNDSGFVLEPMLNPLLTDIAKVSAGDQHSMALDNNGAIFTWGNNYYYQIGKSGSSTSYNTPYRVTNSGTDIAAGGRHSVARYTNGFIYTWGENGQGQLGNGSSYDSSRPVEVDPFISPIAAGYNHSFAISGTNGYAYGWGSGSYGEIGTGYYSNYDRPRNMNTNYKPTKIDAGDEQTIFIFNDSAYICGRVRSESGSSSVKNPSQKVSGNVTDVASGRWHYLALQIDGNVSTVWSWGYNSNGQLGDGSITSRSSDEIVQGLPSNIIDVEAGGHSSFALDTDGNIWAWGMNDSGQLGDGTKTERRIPVKIDTPPGIVEISAGGNFVLARTSTGEVFVWGSNLDGYLCLGKGLHHKKPATVALSLPDISATITQSSVDNVTQEQITASWDITGNPDGVKYKIGVFDYNDNLLSETDWTSDKTMTIDQLDAGTTYIVKLKLQYFTGTERDWEYVDTVQTAHWNLNLQLKDVTHNSINLTINDENPSSTEYLVKSGLMYVDQNGELTDTESWITIDASNNLNIVGLAEMTNYSFAIKSRNSNGDESELSDELQVQTLRLTPELAELDISVTETADNNLKVTIVDDNSVQTVYQIIVGDKYVNSIGELSNYPTWLSLTTPKSIEVKGLNVNQTYGIKVKARNNIGEETVWTEPIYKKIVEEVPTTPTGFSVNIDKNTSTITWDEVTTGPNDNKKHNVNYELEVDGNIIDMKYARKYIHENLKPNSNHSYRVRSYNDAGISDWSELKLLTTPISTPGQANNVDIYAENNCVTISWDYDPNILEYQIYFEEIVEVGQDITVSRDFLITGIESNYYKMYGLNPETDYRIRIDTVNQLKHTTGTSTYRFTTTLLATPVVEIIECDNHEIVYSWGDIEGATAFTYELSYVDTNGVAQTVSSGSAAPTSITFTSDSSQVSTEDMTFVIVDIEDYTTYQFVVEAYSVGGGSSQVSRMQISKTPAIKPRNIAYIYGVAQDKEIELYWESLNYEVTDLDYVDVTSYDVLINSELDQYGNIISGILIENGIEEGDYQTYLQDHINPFTTNDYRIRACTNNAVGDWSEPIEITTLPGLPVVPTGINVDTVGSVTTITWDDMPGNIGYEVKVSDGTSSTVYPLTDNIFEIGNVELGISEIYQLRAINSLGTGEWSGYIINNSMRLQSAYGEEVDLNLTASNILDFSPYVLHVYYNADVLTVRDLCGKTPIFETEAGVITLGEDSIEITEVEPGHITFTVDKEIELGYTWEGIINNIIFEGNISGGTTLDYTVFVDESIIWEEI